MTQKQIMRLLVGLPGSGKSTYATSLDPLRWRRINWDELRKQTPGYVPGHFKRKVEEEMQEHSFGIAAKAASAGYNLVIDNTNLTPRSRDKWKSLAQKLGLDFEIEEMSATVEDCVRRDRWRTGTDRVGRAVIERMALWNGMIKFGPEKIVLVDMDGTLSDSSDRQKYVEERPCSVCNGGGEIYIKPLYSATEQCWACKGTGRAKKDWASFFSHVNEDETNPDVEFMVRLLHECGMKILIVSGRSIDQAGIATEDWLYEKNIPFDHLFMRNSGDKREDTIVKKEILDKLPKNIVYMAIDDRPSIIRMWKDNGINVLDVGKRVEF